MEALELLDVYAKAKEYGIIGLICAVLLKFGGPLLTYILNQLGIRSTRRQTVEDQVAELSKELATLRGNYESLTEMVADAATAMEEEMNVSGIENRVLRVFVDRLKRVQRLA